MQSAYRKDKKWQLTRIQALVLSRRRPQVSCLSWHSVDMQHIWIRLVLHCSLSVNGSLLRSSWSQEKGPKSPSLLLSLHPLVGTVWKISALWIWFDTFQKPKGNSYLPSKVLSRSLQFQAVYVETVPLRQEQDFLVRARGCYPWLPAPAYLPSQKINAQTSLVSQFLIFIQRQPCGIKVHKNKIHGLTVNEQLKEPLGHL